jgi:hypothetical protein
MLLRRGLRLCLAVLLIGLSLLAVTVVRVNSVPRLLNFGNEAKGATCGWVLFSEFLMFDRDFSVTIRANNTVSVYILDESAVRQWSTDKTVNAVWAYENIVDGIFNEPPGGRGGYAVLVYLPEDSVTAIKVVLTFSGFEKDLLISSLTTISVGILSLATLLLITLKNKAHKHNQ